MIVKYNKLYVTLELSEYSDGRIGILLPGYSNRIIVRQNENEHGGHYRLHTALAALLAANEEGDD